MTFDEWLKTVWVEDENRVIRKRQMGELRERIKAKIIEIFESGQTGSSGCTCDNCIAIILEQIDKKSDPPSWLINSLITVALEYLLGENFNGASARYYYTYTKLANKLGDEK